MNNLPLITVATPAYNHEKYIGSTIRSIIDQVYSNLEYIIIDDGSPDSTLDVIKSYQDECSARFQRFFYKTQSNAGITTTLNNLLELAEGEYIFFIASDDLIDPETISTLYSFLAENPDYGAVVPDNKIIDGEGKHCFWGANRELIYKEELATYKTFKEYFQNSRPDFEFNSDQFGTYATLMKGNYAPCGPLIRKKILDQIGGYNRNAPLEDLYQFLQISKLAKIKYIDKPLLSYRWHNANTVLNTEHMYTMTMKTFDLEEGYCREKGYLRHWYLAQAQSLFRLILLHPLRSGNYTLTNLKIAVLGFFPVLFHRIGMRNKRVRKAKQA